MRTKRRLSLAFPHCLVLIISISLCILAFATIGLAVFSFLNKIWGYYLATGFWCGGVVLLNALTGVVATRVRTVDSVKAFMIFSIFGALVSLAMIALSAGGLDWKSNFFEYDGLPWPPPQNRITKIVHGSFLALGVTQLAFCVVSDAVCIYFLFIHKGNVLIPSDSTRGKSSRRHRRNGNRASQRSSDSTVPLYGRESSNQKKQKNKKSNRRNSSESGKLGNGNSKRRASPRGARRNSLTGAGFSPNPCVRSSSFTTFGRPESQTGERESLIVHPDNVSVISAQPPSISGQECHYAQTPLYCPHIPIEEDDELPPYEPVDTNPYYNVPDARASRTSIADSRGSVAPKTEPEITPSRGTQTNAAPSRSSVSGSHSSMCDPDETVAKRVRSLRADLRRQTAVGDSDDVGINRQRRSLSEFPEMTESRSLDLLSSPSEYPTGGQHPRHLRNSDVEDESSYHDQGVSYRGFARSTDRILNPDRNSKPGRSQSVRAVREKRLDRRKRALSAEIRLNKDQIMAQGSMHPEMRTRSIEFGQGGFADERLRPTKFSLRTPIGQPGQKHARRTAVPVRAVTMPRGRAPPKPPRIHSYTKEDLSAAESCDTDGGDSVVFTDEAIDGRTIPAVEEAKIDRLSADIVRKIENLVLNEKKQTEAMKIDAGPVLKCVSPTTPSAPKPLSPSSDTRIYEAPWDTPRRPMFSEKGLSKSDSPKLSMRADAIASSEVPINDITNPVVNNRTDSGRTAPMVPIGPPVIMPKALVEDKPEESPSSSVDTTRKDYEATDALDKDKSSVHIKSSGLDEIKAIDDSDDDESVIHCKQGTVSDAEIKEQGNTTLEDLQNLSVSLPPVSSSFHRKKSPPSELKIMNRAESGPIDKPLSPEVKDADKAPSERSPSMMIGHGISGSDANSGARPKVYPRITQGNHSSSPSYSQTSTKPSSPNRQGYNNSPVNPTTFSSDRSPSRDTRPTHEKAFFVPLARGPLAMARQQNRSSPKSVRSITDQPAARPISRRPLGVQSVSMSSQGVLHLPQSSQFPRQMSSESIPQSTVEDTSNEPVLFPQPQMDQNPNPNPPQLLNNPQEQQQQQQQQQQPQQQQQQQQQANNAPQARPLFSILL